jgi:ABC-type Zn uptake system ZnuABC Zn-binding protein ZnuA
MQKTCQFYTIFILPRLFILLFLCGSVSTSCSKFQKNNSHTLVVTNPAVASLLRSAMSKDACDVEITVLNPTSVQHSFELTPQNVYQVQSSALLVMVGAGMDDWILGASPKQSESISSFVNFKSFGGKKQKDPHFWLDPGMGLRFLNQVGQKIMPYFSKACDLSKVNYALERDRQILIGSQKNWIQKLKHLNGFHVSASHDAFRYFIDFLKLNGILITYEAHHDHGVGAAHLSTIIQELKSEPKNKFMVWDVPPFALCNQLDSQMGHSVQRCYRLDPSGSILSEQMPKFSYHQFFENFVTKLMGRPRD